MSQFKIEPAELARAWRAMIAALRGAFVVRESKRFEKKTLRGFLSLELPL